MSGSSFQTVRLGKGQHASPAHGACVVELASMLAGERFSDHPRCVCPVIAGFLRTYNDLLPEEELEALYPFAALVVGSASSFSVRRRRTVHLLEWAGMRDPARPPRRFMPVASRDETVIAVARAAVRLGRERRGPAVAELLGELVSLGARPERQVAPAYEADGRPAAGMAAAARR